MNLLPTLKVIFNIKPDVISGLCAYLLNAVDGTSTNSLVHAAANANAVAGSLTVEKTQASTKHKFDAAHYQSESKLV